MSYQSRMNCFLRLPRDFGLFKLENKARGAVIYFQVCNLKRHNVYVDIARQPNELPSITKFRQPQ